MGKGSESPGGKRFGGNCEHPCVPLANHMALPLDRPLGRGAEGAAASARWVPSHRGLLCQSWGSPCTDSCERVEEHRGARTGDCSEGPHCRHASGSAHLAQQGVAPASSQLEQRGRPQRSHQEPVGNAHREHGGVRAKRCGPVVKARICSFLRSRKKAAASNTQASLSEIVAWCDLATGRFAARSW